VWTGVLLALSVLLAAAASTAAADVEIPPLTSPVVDQTGVLGPAARDIERKLEAFKAERGAEIAVLVVRTTQPETIEQYSIRVVEKWKLGRTKVDDGALLLVALSDRAVRIEVGRAFEGDIPDVKAFRIIQEQILPRFRQNDIVGGVQAGVDSIIALARGVDLPPPARNEKGDDRSMVLVFIVVLFGIGCILASLFGSLVGSVGTGFLGFVTSVLFVPFGLAALVGIASAFLVLFREPIMWMLLNSSGGYRSGGGGWSSGGRFGSGGTFSGGGASGRW
jgi:uncharacterized protein